MARRLCVIHSPGPFKGRIGVGLPKDGDDKILPQPGRALYGRVQKQVDYVLQRAEGAPLLAFLDPFGLGLSFDDLTGKIFGPQRPRGPGGRNATEALLNFSANAVHRIGGLLKSTTEHKNRAALSAMDAACGGTWWRSEFLSSGSNSEAVERIAQGFAVRAGKAIRADAWTVAVRNRVHHQPVYSAKPSKPNLRPWPATPGAPMTPIY